MKRRTFLAASLAVPFAARAQAPRRTIGLLWNESAQPSPHLPVLLGSLHKLGWTAGRNLNVIDHVALEGYRSLEKSAAQLAQQGCDAIVTYGATATLAAARATRATPIAALIGVDPVRLGLAASLSRPGGNVTGVYATGPLADAASTAQAFARLAASIDRLLRGARPADTPIEQLE